MIKNFENKYGKPNKTILAVDDYPLRVAWTPQRFARHIASRSN